MKEAASPISPSAGGGVFSRYTTGSGAAGAAGLYGAAGKLGTMTGGERGRSAETCGEPKLRVLCVPYEGVEERATCSSLSTTESFIILWWFTSCPSTCRDLIDAIDLSACNMCSVSSLRQKYTSRASITNFSLLSFRKSYVRSAQSDSADNVSVSPLIVNKFGWTEENEMDMFLSANTQS